MVKVDIILTALAIQSMIVGDFADHDSKARGATSILKHI